MTRCALCCGFHSPLRTAPNFALLQSRPFGRRRHSKESRMAQSPSQTGNTGKVLFSPAVIGVFFALLATVVWSFNFVAGRGLAEAVPPCTMAFFRWLIAFLAVLPIALPAVLRERAHFIAHWRYYLITSLIGVTYLNTAIYIGAHTVEALNMSLIAVSSPLYTVALSRILFKEPLPLSRVVGILLALAGVVLLITRGELERLTTLSFNTGDLWMLSAALSFASYTLLVRRKPAGCGDLSFLAVTFGVGLFFLAPFTAYELFVAKADFHFSWQIGGAFLYMGVGASLFAFWCWSRAIGSIGASKASVVYYSLPLFTGLEAVILLGEPLHWVHGVSGLLVISGVAFATREGKRK